MKHDPALDISDIPPEVSATAALVSDWFASRGADYWEFMEICSRNHAGSIPDRYAELINRLIERVCIERVEEIEGRVVSVDEVKEHGRMEVNELNGFARYFWKDSMICEYIPAGMTAKGFRNASITKISPTKILLPFVR